MSTTTRKFKTVITDTGAKKLAQAAAPDGKPVRLTHMAVGDGGGALPTPDSKQTRLVHEVWRHTVNRVILDATHQNRIIAELVIPPETGGFWIREIGVFDEHGDLIAVGNTAESYKPAVAEGSGRAQTFRTILTVSSTATVALTVDNTMVMATVDYVDNKLKEHEQSRRHPDASLTAKGFVQLSSATNSDSETLAATPKAVKVAYDLANGKYTAQDATTARKGLVQLSSATNSTSETLAATSNAVKAAYDNAEKRLQKAKNGEDISDKDTFTKNIGACRAYSAELNIGGDSEAWTTAQLIFWLESQGAFNHPYWMCKGSWAYANNKVITDTGCGSICLAGAVVEVIGTRGAMTIRITTPSTSSGEG
ncbi:phage tail protein, partial [Escherichia coli]